LSSFTSPLIVKIHTHKPREREMFVPFTYITNAGDSIVIPKGFFTDFASSPRLLWALVPPLGTYGKAAVVHDYLYRTPGLKYTRKESDNILREACTVLKVKPYKIAMLYWAVRLFGAYKFTK